MSRPDCDRAVGGRPAAREFHSPSRAAGLDECTEGNRDKGADMLGRKSGTRRLVAAVVPLVIVFVGGCATTINHTYEPSTNFGPLRSHA
jgi:hypothetical protein